MKRCIFYLGCLVLLGCGDDAFTPSGRTIDQIIDDLTEQNYDTLSNIYEVVAYDFCDCLTHADFDPIFERLTRIENGDLEAEGVSQEQITNEESNISTVLTCNMLQLSDRYKGYPAFGDGLDSLATYVSKLCPAFHADFTEFTKRNYPDE